MIRTEIVEYIYIYGLIVLVLLLPRNCTTSLILSLHELIVPLDLLVAKKKKNLFPK